MANSVSYKEFFTTVIITHCCLQVGRDKKLLKAFYPGCLKSFTRGVFTEHAYPKMR